MTFLTAAMLFGLAALVVPPVMHFFNRRKFDEVDWAAMQFLELGTEIRRKLFFEQFLSILLRIGLLALLVFAFAAPELRGKYFGARSAAGPMHLVILVDNSGSMNFQTDGKPDRDAAKLGVARAIDKLNPGDRVALFQVGRTPRPIIGQFTADHASAKGALELFDEPSSAADWPRAVRRAAELLDGVAGSRCILIVNDNQRSTWADESTLGIGNFSRLRVRTFRPSEFGMRCPTVRPSSAMRDWKLCRRRKR